MGKIFLYLAILCGINTFGLYGAGPADTIKVNIEGTGVKIVLSFVKGPSHNHPSFAAWIENKDSVFIQTLFVTQSVATGTFARGSRAKGKWEPAKLSRPAALPYWAHKAGVLEKGKFSEKRSASTEIDAFSGATPKGSSTIESKTNAALPQKILVAVEVNQTWDWNEYWTNNKFPDDEDYKTSCQPSVIYYAEIDPAVKNMPVELKIAGHGHYSGKNGLLYRDISTLTTALKIYSQIVVEVK